MWRDFHAPDATRDGAQAGNCLTRIVESLRDPAKAMTAGARLPGDFHANIGRADVMRRRAGATRKRPLCLKSIISLLKVTVALTEI